MWCRFTGMVMCAIASSTVLIAYPSGFTPTWCGNRTLPRLADGAFCAPPPRLRLESPREGIMLRKEGIAALVGGDDPGGAEAPVLWPIASSRDPPPTPAPPSRVCCIASWVAVCSMLRTRWCQS